MGPTIPLQQPALGGAPRTTQLASAPCRRVAGRGDPRPRTAVWAPARESRRRPPPFRALDGCPGRRGGTAVGTPPRPTPSRTNARDGLSLRPTPLAVRRRRRPPASQEARTWTRDDRVGEALGPTSVSTIQRASPAVRETSFFVSFSEAHKRCLFQSTKRACCPTRVDGGDPRCSARQHSIRGGSEASICATSIVPLATRDAAMPAFEVHAQSLLVESTEIMGPKVGLTITEAERRKLKKDPSEDP